MNDSLPWRFRAARQVAQWLPPLLAPTVTTRLYGFGDACAAPARPWVTAITGSRARWPLDELHGWLHALNRYHDWRLLTVAKATCRPGDTIVEVGANIGTETLCFADIVGASGRVIAIEPLPANVDALRRILADAGTGHVDVLASAAGDRIGHLPFVMPPDEHFSGIGHLGDEGEGARTIDVPVTTLDSLEDGDLHPALIAMDVEGGELAVIRGARQTILRDRPVIVLEACAGHAVRAGNSLAEVRAELEALGYAVRAIRRYGLQPSLTSIDVEPCNWIAVPAERRAILAEVSLRIAVTGLLPPWRWLNPLARRSDQRVPSARAMDSAQPAL